MSTTARPTLDSVAVAAPDAAGRGAAIERYHAVRDLTEALAEPLHPEDQVVQSMPDVSPTKWHRAHTTWFFETFLLTPALPDYRPYHPTFAYLFNSYYESAGPRHPRPQRGLVSRPTVAEVADYRRHVDDGMAELIASADGAAWPDLAGRVELGLHHEQQHQELLLMDIKNVLSRNPLDPAYREAPRSPEPHVAPGAGGARSAGWIDCEGGVVEIGHGERDFAFDNEGPRHQVLLQPFRIADRLVTAGEWQAFIDDGGYERADLWLSDGRYTVEAERWDAPLYWRRDGDGWTTLTLAGRRPVDPAEPVCHVSHYEADAFARWAGARLPTEFEWEHAAAGLPTEGNLLPADPADRAALAGAPLHPVRAPERPGLRQAYGDVWEWTASAYLPYPRFRPAPGAIGEYNGKFMSNQMVLRGGACVTPAGHVRATYRNFFPPAARWVFGGLRLADDA